VHLHIGNGYIAQSNHKVTFFSYAFTEIHQAFSPNIEEVVYAFDQVNFYKLDVPTGQVTIMGNNQYCLNQRFVDKHYVYACRAEEDEGRPGGLYLYDLGNITEKGQTRSYKLQECIVPPKGLMDYNFRNERMCVLEDYHTMMIYPILHRNALPLVGIPQIQYVCAYHKAGNLFSLLFDDQRLVTYQCLTGQIENVSEIDKKVIDLKEFEIFDFSKQPDEHGVMISDDQNTGWWNYNILYKAQPVDGEADVQLNTVQGEIQFQSMIAKPKKENFHFKIL